MVNVNDDDDELANANDDDLMVNNAVVVVMNEIIEGNEHELEMMIDAFLVKFSIQVSNQIKINTIYTHKTTTKRQIEMFD